MANSYFITAEFKAEDYEKIKHLIPDYWHVENTVKVDFRTDYWNENKDLDEAYHALLDSKVDMIWESCNAHDFFHSNTEEGFSIRDGKMNCEWEKKYKNNEEIESNE